MHPKAVLVLCFLLTSAAAAADPPTPKFQPAGAQGIAGEYVVVLADGVARDPLQPGSTGASVADVAEGLAATYGGTIARLYEHALPGFLLRIDEGGARRLAADPAVRLVQQNAPVAVSTVESCIQPLEPPEDAVQAGEPTLLNALPTGFQSIDCSDPDPIRRNGDPAPLPGESSMYHLSCLDNWGLDLLDGNRDSGYALPQGSSGDLTGAGVHVYVLDQGVDANHPEFRNLASVGIRIGTGFNAAVPFAGRDPDTNEDLTDGQLDLLRNDLRDCSGHGTHVAGIVAGNTFGVAKKAIIHPVKFSDPCNDYDATRDTVINGIDWILANHNHLPDLKGPAVVNYSGGNGNHPTGARDDVTKLWVRRLLAAGISFVQSAGNQSQEDVPLVDACERTLAGAPTDPEMPNLRDALIVAGGIDETGSPGQKLYHRWFRETGDPSYDGLCGFDCGSNVGSCVDVWAPAAHIVSATSSDVAATPAAGACRLSGTSMAAPHVTGVVALLLERFPDASPAAIKEAVVAASRSGVLDGSSLGGGPDRLLSVDFPTSGGPIAGDAWYTTPPAVPLVIFIDELEERALDWDGDPLVLSAVDSGDLTLGHLDVGSDRLTYTPFGGSMGVESVSYSVSDGHGGVDSGTIRIEVEQQPRPPVARPDCYETAAGTDLDLGFSTFPQFLENDFDPDGDSFDFKVPKPDHGKVGQLNYPSANYLYRPDAGFTGVETIRYYLHDSYYQKAEGTITVHVGGGSCPVGNSPPVPQDDSLATPYGTALSFLASTLLANDSDPDGDEIVYAGPAAWPQHGDLLIDGIGPEDVVYRYVPDPGFVGTDGFDYKVEDPHGAAGTAHVTITVTSTGFGGNPDAFVTPVDTRLRVLGSQLTANDTAGAHFIRAENPRNGTLVIAGIGPDDVAYDFYPDSGFLGEAGFDYLISPDGYEPYTRVAATVQVVDGAPVAGFTATCTGTACSFDASISSDDMGIASYDWSFDDGATASGMTASHTYARGTYLVTLTVTDTAGHTANDERLIVADALPVPSFTVSCTDLTCSFDASASSDDDGIGSYSWAFGDGSNGSGVTASHTYATSGERTATLTVTDSGGQTASTTRPVVIDLPPTACFTASCTGLTCSVDAGCAGDDIGILSYAWAFGDGSAGSGVTASRTYATSGPRTVTLTVTDARNPGVSTTRTVNPDAQPVASFAWSCVQRTCSFDGTGSTDNQPIAAYAWVFGDGTAGNGAAASRTYAVGGSYGVRLTVTDSVGQTGTKLVTIAVNRPPVAANDSAATFRNTAKDVNVLANDSDPDGDPLTVASWTQPAHGSVSKNANGTLRYVPASGYTGGDSFTYTASDGRGDTATATVSLTVKVPNTVPDARDDGWATYIDGATTITFSHMLANDYDADGDGLVISGFNTSGLAGTLDCSSGTYCRYTPSYHFVGTTSFTYTVSDGKGGSDPATVRIKVGVTNGYPTPQDDILETTRDTSFTFTRATLLANDTDPDGDVLSVPLVSRSVTVGFGTVACSTANYTCTYTPAAGFTGVDVLTYRSSDGIAYTTAYLRILVRPGTPLALDAREDQIFTTTSVTYIRYTKLLMNDYDPEGGALTIVNIDTTGLQGTLDCTTWTTGCDYYRGTSSPTRFRYTVRDSQGNLDTTTVTIKPGNWSFNKTPVLTPDQLTTARNTPLQFSVFDLMRNDYDPDNDQLDVRPNWYTQHGTVSCSASFYVCTYTPSTGFTGVDTLTYSAYDGTNNPSSTATITVTP